MTSKRGQSSPGLAEYWVRYHPTWDKGGREYFEANPDGSTRVQARCINVRATYMTRCTLAISMPPDPPRQIVGKITKEQFEALWNLAEES